MNRPGRLAANSLVALSLLTCEASSAIPDTPVESTAGLFAISAIEKQSIGNTFEQGKAYWLRQKVGYVAHTKLITISNDETVSCPTVTGEYRQTSFSNATYCPSLNAVLLSASTVRAFSQSEFFDGNPQAAIDFTILHELGHGVQQGRDSTITGYSQATDAERARIELQADCLAGQAMHELRPAEVLGTAKILRETPRIDNSHGSSTQSASAFLQGASEKPC